MPKRHCMIVYAPYPLGETRVQREAEALIRQGNQVDVICVRVRGERARDVYQGVRIYREKFSPPWGVSAAEGLFERLLCYLIFFMTAGWRVTWLHLIGRPGRRLHGYDSLQVHNLPDFLVFCTLIPRVLGAPVILDLHDLMPEFFAGRFGSGHSLGARLIRLQERWACRFASHVITVSEHWRQALIRRGVPEQKCSVVMNVADECIFRAPETCALRPRPAGELRLIYHGSIHARYGLHIAVAALDKLRAEIPGIHFTIVGAGTALADVRAQVARLGLQKQVTFMPLVPAEQLPEIIRGCDLGVVPYQNDVFTDGLLPTKLMEYAAMGLPAVAARTTANQVYFSNANTEFFEPGNAEDLARVILDLFNSPERLLALCQGSQNFNRMYNWKTVSEEYVATVERLRKQARRPPGDWPVGSSALSNSD